jgi:uncharacterized membrane protein YbhN (UPF0104 family)
MRVFVLELVGLGCLIGAAWLVSPAFGMAVIGVACLVSAFAMSRVVKDDK